MGTEIPGKSGKDVDFNKNCLLAVMSEGAADLVQDCGPDSETWTKARTYEQYMTELF